MFHYCDEDGYDYIHRIVECFFYTFDSPEERKVWKARKQSATERLRTNATDSSTNFLTLRTYRLRKNTLLNARK